MSPIDIDEIDQETRVEHSVVELHESDGIDVEVADEDGIDQ